MTRTIAFSWLLPIKTEAGGIERVTARLMDGLAQRGHDCIFLTHDTETGTYFLDGADIGDIDDFLDRHSVDTLVNQNGYSSAVTEDLQGSEWQGRYVVCHHNEPLYLRKIFDPRGVIGMVCARRAPPSQRLSWFGRLVSYPLWQWLSTRQIAATQTRNYERADSYVVLSPAFLPHLRKLLRHEITKAVAIPNPLSFDIAPEETARFEKRREVLVVARLNDGEKRISAALEAWRRVEKRDQDGWTLNIVGDGPDAATLKHKAHALGLQRVRFLGRQDPLPYYRSAGIFLMTSRVEGWGLTLTEAMQTGAVPVAFDAYASLRDIVKDGATGVVVSNGDTSSFADAVLLLMKDPVRRETMATRATEAAQRYCLERVLDQWEAIL